MNYLTQVRSKFVFAILFVLLSGVVSAQQLPAPRNPGSDIPRSNTIFHTSEAGNIAFYWTAIDNPMTNANPNSVLFVTHNYTSGFANYVPHALGVNGGVVQWTIILQDAAETMVEGAAFNVQVQGLGGNVFQHIASPASISLQVSYIDHPLTNGNPNALLFFTPNSAVSPVNNTAPVGVWYDGDIGKWAFFNQDLSNFPVGFALNVQVLSASDLAFVHTATVGSLILPHATLIDHPMLNGNPNAQLIVNQVWNPGGEVDGVWNENHIGVWYHPVEQRWAIFNENQAALAVGASFNVHIAGVRNTNRLSVNGSFEAPHANGNSQAAGWTFAGGTKRKCNKYDPVKIRSYSGECALQMKGGTNAKAKQVISIGSTAANAKLSAALKGSNLTEGTTKAIAQIRFDNGTKFKLALDTTALPSADFTVRDIDTSLLGFGTVETVKLLLKVKGPTGKLFADDVSLTLTGASVSSDRLPVPPAPDGWRG